jgi:tetratricopeptide (TPR) repeat protein
MYEKAAANYDYVATQDLTTYPRFKMELDTFGMDQEEIERKKIETKKSSPVAISQEDAGYNAIVALDNLRKQKMQEQNLTEEQSFSLPETKKFIDYITNFTTRFPKSNNSPEVLYLAGNVFFSAKKYDEAIDAFKKLLSKYARTQYGNKAVRMLANTQTAAGQYDQALKNYKKAISAEKPNTQEHAEVVDLAGGALFKKATDTKKAGDLTKASKLYKSIFKQYPTSTVGDKGWFEAGVSLEEANKIEDAAKTFELLGANFPKSQLREKAYVRSAENYKKLEKWEQAGFVFEKAASEIPKAEYAIPSLSSAAENYEKAKMFSKAGQMYRSILTKYPTDKQTPLAVYNGGLIYEKGELYEKAIDMYLILGEKYPESEYAPEGFFSIGICYEKLKKPTQMAKYFKEYAEKFTENRSKQIDALVRAGKAYMELKKYSEAEKSAELATTVYEKYKDKATIDPVAASKAYFTLGEIHQANLDNIMLVGKNEKQVSSQLEKKTQALKPVLTAYTKAIQLGVGEWTIRSTYQIGKSFVDFATAFENQTLFGRKDQQTASKIKIISGLEKYYTQAMEKFYWNVNTAWEQNIKTEWVDKSKEEFTRLAYRKGFLFEKIGRIFKDAPVPRGMTKEEITAYKDVLEEKYLEALDAALPKYEEGFFAAKELGITGSKWIDSLTTRVSFINPSSKILSETISERAPKPLNGANVTPTPTTPSSNETQAPDTAADEAIKNDTELLGDASNEESK